MEMQSKLTQETAGLSQAERIQHLESELERYRALLAKLEARDAVTRIVAESVSLEEAIPAILRAICEFLGWEVGVFWSPEEKLGVLQARAAWNAGEFSGFVAEATRTTVSASLGLPGRVWLQQEPEWTTDLKEENCSFAASATRHGLCSSFAFPIGLDKPEGLLEFFSSGRREPDAAFLQMSVIIGHQIGAFFQRRRSADQMLRQAKIALLRAELSAALNRAGDLGSILRECTDAIVKHLGVAFARVWTLNTAERRLELQSSSGLYTHINGGHSIIPVGAFKIGWIAENRKPHLTNSVVEDPRVTHHEWARREGMQAFAGYPLLVEDRVMGVLAMFSRENLDEFVLDELAPISDAIAQFLDRRRAEGELRRSEALKAAMLETALDAVVAMSHTGRIVEFNLAAEAMFGYKRAEVMGLSIADVIVPPRLRDAHRMGLSRYLRTGESHIMGRRIIVDAMRSDGSEFPVELSIGQIATEGPSIFTASIRHQLPSA